MRRPRLVIDTNVWISALLNKKGAPFSILSLYRTGKVEIVASPALLEELGDVLSRQKFAQKYRITVYGASDIITHGAGFLRPRGHLGLDRLEHLLATKERQ